MLISFGVWTCIRVETLLLSIIKFQVNAIQWDPLGNRLASASDDKTVKIWSVDQETYLMDLSGHFNEVSSIAWSCTGPGTPNPNANLILASVSVESVKLWDVERGVSLLTMNPHGAEDSLIAFSPNGQHLASGSKNKWVNIWCTTTGKMVIKVAFGLEKFWLKIYDFRFLLIFLF